MPIKVTCTNCGGVLHAPDDAAGKRGRCPTCGTVLTIADDAPRVPAQAPVPPPAASGPLEAAAGRAIPYPVQPPSPPPPPRQLPGLAEASVGIPVPTRPPAEPNPPARGAAPPRPPAPAQSSTYGVQMTPGPAKYSDPFLKPGRTPDAAASASAARAWASVRRGLGWMQAGVVLLFLGVAACPGIEIAEQLGAKLPDQNPGFLKTQGLSADIEIRLAGTLIPAALGVLFFALGRLGAASAPRESLGRGIAKAAAWAGIAALAGLIAVGVVTGLATANGGPPQIVPEPRVLQPGVRLQERVELYLGRLFLVSSEPSGQVQRIGVLILLTFGTLAEFWFFHALGRYAAALQSPTAAGRVTRFLVLVGVLGVLAAFGLTLYDLYGEQWVRAQLRPRWNDLGPKWQSVAISGTVIAAAFVLAVLYYRVLGGVKRGIRDTYDGIAAA